MMKRNVNKKNKKINKKVNLNSFKRFIVPAVFVLSLMTSYTGAHAAEQVPGQQTEQPQEQQAEQQTATEPAATGVEIPGTTMMYAVKNVNVRKEPNTSSGILGELEAGTNIFAVELTDEGWYRVVYGGETGYIRGDFLAIYENMADWSASEPEPEPIEELDEDEAEDVTDSLGDDAEGKAAENAEVIENKEEQSKGKNNIFTILIIVALVIAIFVYAVIQIVKDKANPGEDYDDEPEEEPYEEDFEDEPEEDIEMIDLDGDE